MFLMICKLLYKQQTISCLFFFSKLTEISHAPLLLIYTLSPGNFCWTNQAFVLQIHKIYLKKNQQKIFFSYSQIIITVMLEKVLELYITSCPFFTFQISSIYFRTLRAVDDPFISVLESIPDQYQMSIYLFLNK